LFAAQVSGAVKSLTMRHEAVKCQSFDVIVDN
jgi:hypothetical protein